MEFVESIRNLDFGMRNAEMGHKIRYSVFRFFVVNAWG